MRNSSLGVADGPPKPLLGISALTGNLPPQTRARAQADVKQADVKPGLNSNPAPPPHPRLHRLVSFSLNPNFWAQREGLTARPPPLARGLPPKPATRVGADSGFAPQLQSRRRGRARQPGPGLAPLGPEFKNHPPQTWARGRTQRDHTQWATCHPPQKPEAQSPRTGLCAVSEIESTGPAGGPQTDVRTEPAEPPRPGPAQAGKAATPACGAPRQRQALGAGRRPGGRAPCRPRRFPAAPPAPAAGPSPGWPCPAP